MIKNVSRLIKNAVIGLILSGSSFSVKFLFVISLILNNFLKAK